MSILLRRVELANIRAHKHLVFEPAEHGLTSIHGPNGSGKSTIVDSIAWCLYGTKPPGVSKAAILAREGTNLGKEKAFVAVDIEVDGRSLRILRKFVSKGGSVECEVLEKQGTKTGEDGAEETDWKRVAGPAVSHAEPYVRKFLHMDEKGFLAAILIQQKQVDQLISATPRERAAVIEKLTGIASVTAAVTEARQEYNSLKRMATYSTVNEEELAALRADHAALQEELHARTAAHNALVAQEKQVKKEGAALRARVTEETAKADAAEEAKHRLATLAGSMEAKEKELTRVAADKDSKKKRLSRLAAGSDLAEVSRKRDELRKKLGALSEEAYGVKTKLLDSEEATRSHSELIQRSSIKELDPARSGLQEQEKKLAQAERKATALLREASGLEAKVEQLSGAIHILKEGEGSCPTCLQKVTDVSSAVGTLEQELSTVEKAAAANREAQDKLEAYRNEGAVRLEKFRRLVTALEELETLAEQRPALELKQQELEGVRRSLEGEASALEKVYAEVKAQEELKEEYSRLLSTAQAISDEIEAMRTEEASLKAKDFGALTPTALGKLRKELEETSTAYLALTARLTEERGEVRLLRERSAHQEEKIAEQEEAIRKHKELLKAVEVASNSTQLLEEFRSNRIEHSVPLIEAYSSDLLSRFTEGKFTRLKLDGKFNASVTLSDGTERAIGLLSGGELSAASMALRLAISILLNGGSGQSLIILDEVLVSQDVTRSELILSTIKETCRGQVVLIAHNDSVHDLSDKLVELA